jgi:hypothetical protein
LSAGGKEASRSVLLERSPTRQRLLMCSVSGSRPREVDIVIRRAVPRFTLEDLFRGKSPEEWRALMLVRLTGPDVGREAVEE